MTLAVDDQLRKDGAVGSSACCPSNPPLGSTEMRSVDDELIRGFVECGSRLKSSNVGTVSKFGHAETADDTVEAENATLDPIA